MRPQTQRQQYELWFLGGRLIALCKPGDRPDGGASERKLRPIAIGSTIGRAISMVAADFYRHSFARYLQPPPPSLGPQARQPDGAPWPVQVGVACRSGLEFVVHTVQYGPNQSPSSQWPMPTDGCDSNLCPVLKRFATCLSEACR